MSEAKIAVILLRGRIGLSPGVREALDALRLRRRLSCAVVPDTKQMRGSLQKVKDVVTFGVLDEATAKALAAARKPTHEGVITTYALHPPRGGFEKRGIKFAYQQGGALGNRNEKIGDLIKRML